MVVKSLSTSWKQENKRVIVWLILCLQLGKHRRYLPVWRKPLYFLACQSDVSPLFPGVLWKGRHEGGTGATPMVFLSLYSAVAFQSHHTKKEPRPFGLTLLFIPAILFKKQKNAEGGTWTRTVLLPQAPEACASANSATSAFCSSNNTSNF